jgi:tetratricopeptide (TPR) repeat protein
MPGLDWYLVELYTGMVRFGLWDDILAEPAPNSKLTGLATGYLYAKAAALAANGRVDEAKTKVAELGKLATATPPDADAGLNTLADVLAVAVLSANARIASAEHRDEDAISNLSEAVAKEDRLAYDEPADWFVPTGQLLGAALIKLGKATDAETVYREDLNRHPNNGWSLDGLAQSLRMQGRDGEAQATQRQFDAAWKNADVTLVASAF